MVVGIHACILVDVDVSAVLSFKGLAQVVWVFVDGFHDVLLSSGGRVAPPGGGCLFAVLSRLRGILEEAEGVLYVGAAVTAVIQCHDMLTEDALKAVGEDELLDCLLSFFVSLHIFIFSLTF
jgi:hypothetical protein